MPIWLNDCKIITRFAITCTVGEACHACVKRAARLSCLRHRRHTLFKARSPSSDGLQPRSDGLFHTFGVTVSHGPVNFQKYAMMMPRRYTNLMHEVSFFQGWDQSLSVLFGLDFLPLSSAGSLAFRRNGHEKRAMAHDQRASQMIARCQPMVVNPQQGSRLTL